MIPIRKTHPNEDNHTFNISGKNPKFFKIIIQDPIQEGRLAIPKKFVREYGKSLGGDTVLRVSDGKKWKVELSKCGNYGAWLEKGWKEFAEHYSVKHGYLLLFEYEQDRSNFIVFIFDTTLVEIRYPIPEKPNMEQNQNPSKIGQQPQPNGSVKTEEHEESPQGKLNESKGGKRGRKKKSKSTTSQAVEAAKKLTLTNPSFKVALKSNHHGRIPMVRNSLSIPIGFIREHMECKIQQIILNVEGKVWAVKMNVYAKHGRAAFSAGWPAFAKENSLKDEDVCVFELVKKNMFQVHIFRHA